MKNSKQPHSTILGPSDHSGPFRPFGQLGANLDNFSIRGHLWNVLTGGDNWAKKGEKLHRSTLYVQLLVQTEKA